MKRQAESFCTNCPWHGDGTGLVECPDCGSPITALDETAADPDEDDKEYPDEVMKMADEEDEIS